MGHGFTLRGHDSLFRAQDPRRIDVSATLRNPFGEVIVRTFNQKSVLPVQVVVDMSASMMAGDPVKRMKTIRSMVVSLGYSARQYGDRFGMIACGDHVHRELQMPLSRDVGRLREVLNHLNPAGFKGGAGALVDVGRLLGRKRGIVFLMSDFLLPIGQLKNVLRVMAGQCVVPVVTGLPATVLPDRPIPGGMMTLGDSENGKLKTLYWRNSVRERFERQVTQYREVLEKCFHANGTRPLYLDHGFSADQVNRYFLHG